tara:strand:+ start:2929 stop:3099 length:171 start_codon:yes stop_codon:yes gene_type:complete
MDKQDYRKKFLLGIILVGVGITFTNTINRPVGIVLLSMGGLLMLLGAKNKDKWKKD